MTDLKIEKNIENTEKNIENTEKNIQNNKNEDRDNINPIIWGTSGWKFIHYIALAYPIEPTDKVKKEYKIFFNMIKYVLPCEKCRNNYEKHLKIYPIEEYLNDKKSLFKWTVHMHNAVNKENNKKEFTLMESLESHPCTLKKNKKISENFLNNGGEISCSIEDIDDNSSKKKNYYILFIMIIIVALISILLLINKK